MYLGLLTVEINILDLNDNAPVFKVEFNIIVQIILLISKFYNMQIHFFSACNYLESWLLLKWRLAAVNRNWTIYCLTFTVSAA